jgi:flagellar motor protein MotB
MRKSARGVRAFVLLALMGAAQSGCTSGPFYNPFSMQPNSQAVRPQASPGFAQQRDLQQRNAALDADNQHLQALVAQQQQQTSQMQAALQQSQRELADARNQQDSGGSVARRGVSARAASHGGALPLARIQGADVVQDGDLVRIRLESAQLFGPGRAELKPEVSGTLDRVAQALKSDYSGRLVGIEGHTDADPITKSKWKNNHELSVARSVAVFEALKRRGVPESQLYVSGYGPNHPLAASNSKQSKSHNRRVEIVVYPEAAG